MTIKELRTEKKLTQQQFADSVGVSKQAISQFESGKCQVSVKLAQQIGKVYNVAWYLFFEDEVKC